MSLLAGQPRAAPVGRAPWWRRGLLLLLAAALSRPVLAIRRLEGDAAEWPLFAAHAPCRDYCGSIPISRLRRPGGEDLHVGCVPPSEEARRDMIPECEKDSSAMNQAGGHADAFFKLRSGHIAKLSPAFEEPVTEKVRSGLVEWSAYMEMWCVRRLEELSAAGALEGLSSEEDNWFTPDLLQDLLRSHPLRYFALGGSDEAWAPRFYGLCSVREGEFNGDKELRAEKQKDHLLDVSLDSIEEASSDHFEDLSMIVGEDGADEDSDDKEGEEDQDEVPPLPFEPSGRAPRRTMARAYTQKFKRSPMGMDASKIMQFTQEDQPVKRLNTEVVDSKPASSMKLYMVMENVLGRFTSPCQLDLKLGWYTAEPTTRLKKWLTMTMVDYASPSRSQAARLAGMTKWNPQLGRFEKSREMKWAQLMSIGGVFTKFFDLDPEDPTQGVLGAIRQGALEALRERLLNVSVWWSEHGKTDLRSVALSALMAYECRPRRVRNLKLSGIQIEQVQEDEKEESTEEVKDTELPTDKFRLATFVAPAGNDDDEDGAGARLAPLVSSEPKSFHEFGRFKWPFKGVVNLDDVTTKEGEVTFEVEVVDSSDCGKNEKPPCGSEVRPCASPASRCLSARLPLGSAEEAALGSGGDAKLESLCAPLLPVRRSPSGDDDDEGNGPPEGEGEPAEGLRRPLRICLSLLTSFSERSSPLPQPVLKLIDYAHFFPQAQVSNWREDGVAEGLLTALAQIDWRLGVSGQLETLPMQEGEWLDVTEEPEGRNKKCESGTKAHITFSECMQYATYRDKSFFSWKRLSSKWQPLGSAEAVGSCRVCDTLVNQKKSYFSVSRWREGPWKVFMWVAQSDCLSDNMTEEMRRRLCRQVDAAEAQGSQLFENIESLPLQ